jgi:hypothetical protein
MRACVQAPELGKGGVTFVMGWKPNNNLLPILGGTKDDFYTGNRHEFLN